MKQKVEDRITRVNLEGYLDNVIEHLIALKKEYKITEDDNLRLTTHDWDDYSEYYLVRDRLETDNEYQKRLAREEKETMKQLKAKEAFKKSKEKRELKEYERLKKIYEASKKN